MYLLYYVYTKYFMLSTWQRADLLQYYYNKELFPQPQVWVWGNNSEVKYLVIVYRAELHHLIHMQPRIVKHILILID